MLSFASFCWMMWIHWSKVKCKLYIYCNWTRLPKRLDCSMQLWTLNAIYQNYWKQVAHTHIKLNRIKVILLFLFCLYVKSEIDVSLLFVNLAVTCYSLRSVLEAFGLTCAVTAALTVYTLQSKRDFSTWGAGCVHFATGWLLLNKIHCIKNTLIQQFSWSRTC